MRCETEYFVGSDKNCNIEFRKEETDFGGVTITIKFRDIMVIVIIVMAIIYSEFFVNIIIRTKNVEAVNFSIIGEQGFVFEDSDKRLITSEEINALKDSTEYSFEELLAFSRNELYSRKGQVFSEGGFWDLYYEQYEWYQKTNKHNVDWSEFNDVEKENLRSIPVIH